MKQAIFTTPGNIEFSDVEAPGKMAPNVNLLKIQHIGVCGSDIHVFHGDHPVTPFPVVQGHEYSATIASVSDAVKLAKVGQRLLGAKTIGMPSPHPDFSHFVCSIFIDSFRLIRLEQAG